MIIIENLLFIDSLHINCLIKCVYLLLFDILTTISHNNTYLKYQYLFVRSLLESYMRTISSNRHNIKIIIINISNVMFCIKNNEI